MLCEKDKTNGYSNINTTYIYYRILDQLTLHRVYNMNISQSVIQWTFYWVYNMDLSHENIILCYINWYYIEFTTWIYQSVKPMDITWDSQSVKSIDMIMSL